jgi:excinuclease ABC subunit C
LDDIEGINKSRKQALLRAFGSVERVRCADADEIAAVPGIGARLAGQIKAGLAAESAKRLRGSRVSP